MRAHGGWLAGVLGVVMAAGAVAGWAQTGSGAGPVVGSALAEEDGRLNAAYRERVAQVEGDAGAMAALRGSERAWIRDRDKQCGKGADCLVRVTRERADLLQRQAGEATRAVKAGSAVAPIPAELWGRWTVRKVLPTETISCWDNGQARALVGTELEYSGDGFRWKNKRVKNLGAKSRDVSAAEFAEDNSGGGAVDSRVNFKELGIRGTAVREISIRHPDVVMGAGDGAGEMPGETVLLSAPGRLIFSVCNVYFEASRPELE